MSLRNVKLPIKRNHPELQRISIRDLEMHLKSCSKLVRSELRLDLGQQQGAFLRRGQSNRLPLATLSPNTLRCSQQGGANTLRCSHAVAPRAKGTENSGFTEEESPLDVWSVIRPGHVREKIALFAHDSDHNAKGSWNVSAKRRRRSSQNQFQQAPPPSVTVTLQPVAQDPTPPEGTDTDPKLSVVEMVAYLEQRVTCSPHAKLRSSASITLSRAPPPLLLNPTPSTVPAEEPESLSVSDMVAKLESQCLRRRTPGERRVVGRVLLAEQHSEPQPISYSETPKGPPPPSSQSRRTSLKLCRSEVKLKACFSTEMKVPKTSQTTPSAQHECNNVIGRGRTESPPSIQMKESKSKPVLFFCKAEKTAREKTKVVKKQDCSAVQKTAVTSAAILTLSVCPEATVRTNASLEAKSIQAEKILHERVSSKSLDFAKLDCDKMSPLSSKPEKPSMHDEPLPGLLFLTPPSRPCIQSEPSPASSSSNTSSDSLPVLPMSHTVTKADQETTDSLVVLSLDLSSNCSRVEEEESGRGDWTKRRDEPSDLALQSQQRKLSGTESDSGRTHLKLTEGGATSGNKSSQETVAVLHAQSEASLKILNRRTGTELLQSHVTQLPQPSQSDLSEGQSEVRRRLSRPATEGCDVRMGGAVLLRSSSDVGSERRRRRKAARAFSLCEGGGRAASEDFLLMRHRLQCLLEPRMQVSYLSLLPHHLLLHILLLLPTRALAALKCSCRYLRLIIDEYDPRPLDALWVCDPRYRDDPCKQCKRRRGRGDVSLCRWHHKPFCQAMPYGPGYWMCCHGDRRDAPGCNVGRHDNRWVPEFHSINSPLYRQRVRGEEPEE